MGLLDVLGLKPKAGSGAPPPAGPDKSRLAFDAARALVAKLVAKLNAHPQKARIAAQIAEANAKLAEADAHAAKAEWAEASRSLARVQAICVAATTLADAHANYLVQRVKAMNVALSFDSADSDFGIGEVADLLEAADKFRDASPPDFPSALASLAAVSTRLKPYAQALITQVKARLSTVEATSASVKAFAKPDIDQGKVYIANADAALASSEWSVCRQNAISALRVLGPAVRLVQRRGDFEKQRDAAVKAIDAVEIVNAVADRAAPLAAQLAQAEALATRDVRKFEEGGQLAKAAADRARLWTGLAPSVAMARQASAEAETELALLDKQPSAAEITPQREAARKLVVQAKAAVDAASAAAVADPAAAWSAALSTATRARTDVAAAKALAAQLGPATKAQAAAAAPGDAKAMKAALDALVADGEAAAKGPDAEQAAALFKQFHTQCAAAGEALQGKDPSKAATPLADAAKTLAQAHALQAGHGQAMAALQAAETDLKALSASPRAAEIKPSLDAVAAAVALAHAKDKAHDPAAALTAARHAQDAVGTAKAADKSRADFDAELARLQPAVAATTDKAEKAALDKLVASARKLADTLAFPAAASELKKLGVRLDKAKLRATVAANPADPDIAKIAARMVDAGGAAEVDAMIQAQPDGDDTRAINALAEGRYGVKFQTGLPEKEPLTEGDPAKAMKTICATFAKFPQDVRKNPSLTSVTHTDADDSVGGAHDFDNASVSLSGRPGAVDQEFGAAQKSPDLDTGRDVPTLPAAIDAKCQPKNTKPVDFLAFAAAHEVGHAVDDKRGFMANHGAGEKYGGWITYGSSVQPLADIIGADARFSACYATPEQKQYILDKLLNKEATPPPDAPGTPAGNARLAFDTWYTKATSTDIYRRQGDCDAIKIGDRIYHEAYARNWVSYLAKARHQALTGYQFRAPGEWFAELYAGYRSGKLKDDHPAMEWLKKL